MGEQARANDEIEGGASERGGEILLLLSKAFAAEHGATSKEAKVLSFPRD